MPRHRIRLLAAGDLANAFELSRAAGWNQTIEDWRMLLTLEPGACFAIECDGQLAATATLVCYGPRLAWLGMVLTHADFRRRGFARALVHQALSVADARAIETVKLDATEEGRLVYAALGFMEEQPIERWYGACDLHQHVPAGAALAPDSFPAPRTRLLEALAARRPPIVTAGGFVFTRPGALAEFLGPCVANHPAAAEPLIRAALSTHAGEWFWDLLPANASATALALRLGFHPVRRLTRMYRGRACRADETRVFALAGFEFG